MTSSGSPNSATGWGGAGENPWVDTSSSDSGSLYGNSDSPSLGTSVCRWRTARFYDQECSRFFDCPSHIVERVLSDHEADRDSPSTSSQGASADSRQGSETSQQASQEATPSHDQASPAAASHGGLAPAPLYTPDMPTPVATTTSTSRGEAAFNDPALPAGAQQRINTSSFSPVDYVHSQMTLPSSPGTPQSPEDLSRRESIILTQDHGQHAAVSSPQIQSPGYSAGRSTRHSEPQPMMAAERSPEAHTLPEVILPRWQPDAEVTFCPICRTQFSFFVRKHHCRKCGRVVCNSCSPHRITIPYQYIVQPPDCPRLSAQRYPPSLAGVEGRLADLSLGGGEKVRLCNPCVPDPNVTPPRPQASPTQASMRGGHHRSRSNVTSGLGAVHSPSRFQGYFPLGPTPDAFARHRSVTHSGPNVAGPSSSRAAFPSSTQSRILAGTPPTYVPPSSSAYPGAASSHGRYRPVVGASSSASALAQNRALPPTPQIAEEDECPICHRELPPQNLPNFEALREAHITICITSHSTYSTTPGGVNSQNSPQGAIGTPPPLAARRTGMFPYAATEKDCVDSAECTICLEEFEVGVQMARLECLCRFHRSCISAWFVNHPGRCPVHQHDSFGY